jgi:hypothetical protein
MAIFSFIGWLLPESIVALPDAPGKLDLGRILRAVHKSGCRASGEAECGTGGGLGNYFCKLVNP